MKRIPSITLILTASLLAVGNAFAQNTETCNAKDKQASFLELYDSDGDGLLSYEEKQAAKEEMGAMSDRPLNNKVRNRIVEEFDADGDGELSPEERQAARAASEERMAKRQAELLAKYDADGDGELSESEKNTAFAEKLEERPELKNRIMKRFDSDGDGELSDIELTEARTATQARMQQQAKQRRERAPVAEGRRPGPPKVQGSAL